MTLLDKRRGAVLAALLAAGSLAAYRIARTPVPQVNVIPIEAQRFRYQPGHVVLKRGEPVVFELTSRDVVMGFSLPDFNLRADMIPGKVIRVRFVPDKLGIFTFLCDVFCGAGHEQMEGSIEVVE